MLLREIGTEECSCDHVQILVYTALHKLLGSLFCVLYFNFFLQVPKENVSFSIGFTPKKALGRLLGRKVCISILYSIKIVFID